MILFWRSGLNRTIVELKPTQIVVSGWQSIELESNHRGIETLKWREERREEIAGLNRTIVELKHHLGSLEAETVNRLNRTIVELKHLYSQAIDLKLPSLNRTIVELKPVACDLALHPLRRLESNHRGIETTIPTNWRDFNALA